MGIDEANLQKCLTDLNNKARNPEDIQSSIDTLKHDITMSDSTDQLYDKVVEGESKVKIIFLTAYVKDGKVKKFIYANAIKGADKLFVYINDKVFKNDGVRSYIMFLYDLNITHEEFIICLERIYEQNIN